MLCHAWAEDLEGCGTPPDADPALVESALLVASEILYKLSGRQFPGLCDVTFRPCGDSCNCSYDTCGCNRLPAVFLARNVDSVSSVNIDGVELDSDAYRVSSGWLLRLDGAAWPCCQDLAAAPGEADTFTVTGLVGRLPDETGIRAAKALAVELVKACIPSETCALPERVTNVVRQGVSFTVLDPMEFLEGGRTGIYIVDLFLRAANPAGLARRASAWSPDLPVTIQEPVSSS